MISKRMFIITLIGLVIIRVIMVMGLVNGIPETSDHEGWFFHHGGDEEEYFRQAMALAKFQKINNVYYIMGFPLLLVPFIVIFKAYTFEDILVPVVVFHSFILFGVSIILIALIAQRLFQDRQIALLSSALWTFFPYFVMLLATIIGKPELGGIWMVHQMWLQVLSDPPSAFLILLSTYIYLVSLKKNNLWYPFILGISFGYATLIRPQNIALFVLFISVWLYKKKFKEIMVFVSTYIFMGVVQLVYNWYTREPDFWFFYNSIEKDFVAKMSFHSLFSVSNIPFFILWVKSKISNFLIFFAVLFFGLMLLTMIYIYRHHRLSAAILTVWIFSYTLFYGCYYGFVAEIFRYLMPVFPACIILISVLFLKCPEIVKESLLWLRKR